MKRAIINRIFTRSNSVFAKPKRFYKNVTVEEDSEAGLEKPLYKVMLDKRRLRTQGGKVLKVSWFYW